MAKRRFQFSLRSMFLLVTGIYALVALVAFVIQHPEVLRLLAFFVPGTLVLAVAALKPNTGDRARVDVFVGVIVLFFGWVAFLVLDPLSVQN